MGIEMKELPEWSCPKDDRWCVVECWEYSPSGYHIAKYEFGKWKNEMEEDITEYVTAYFEIEE
jgi:hypothetical protein